MDVKFITTTSNKLSELPIVSGQLIYLSDINATYYDMSGDRNPISSMRVVASLPLTGQEGVLYGVVNAAGHVDASIWDESNSVYRQLSGYVATTTSVGLVKPDGTTITIDNDGTVHATVTTSLAATAVTYDNTVSGLAATNVQDAFDEIASTVSGFQTTFTSYEARLQALEELSEIVLTTEGSSTAVNEG